MPRRYLDYYRLHWRIEDWYRILISGCKAEFPNPKVQTAWNGPPSSSWSLGDGINDVDRVLIPLLDEFAMTKTVYPDTNFKLIYELTARQNSPLCK